MCLVSVSYYRPFPGLPHLLNWRYSCWMTIKGILAEPVTLCTGKSYNRKALPVFLSSFRFCFLFPFALFSFSFSFYLCLPFFTSTFIFFALIFFLAAFTPQTFAKNGFSASHFRHDSRLPCPHKARFTKRVKKLVCTYYLEHACTLWVEDEGS